ncbi:uncharacterized protein LOC135119894 isoform X2 [Zophobas morio]|uniref:uncharacterized protein LOC135119894 isoform X2 n=1 Tax=Zophobas morio TaxID=2755281 RepID=UPI00308365AC
MKDEAALPRLVLGDVVRIQKATTKFYQGKLQLSLKKDDFRFLAFNSKRLRVEILRKLAWGGVLEIHHPKCRQQIRFSSATRVAVSDYDFKRLAELRKFASQKLELGIELTSPRPYLVKLKDLLPPFASVTVVAQLCNVSSEEKDSCVLEIMDGSVPPHISKSQVAPGRVLVRAPGSTKEQIAALLHKWVLFSGLFSLPESEGGECRVGLKASPHAFCLLSDDDEDVQERLDGLCRQGWPFVCQRRIDMAATPNDVTSLCSVSHPNRKISPLSQILQEHEAPNTFRCRARVVAFFPRTLTAFTFAKCTACEDGVVSRQQGACLKCFRENNDRIVYEYFFVLQVTDGTGEIDIIVAKNHAVEFLNGLCPENLYDDESKVHGLAGILALALSGEYFLDLCIQSYKVNGNIKYQLVRTKLRLLLQF